MVIAGFWFTVGAIINCAAQDLAMLYIGRILLGFGVGFANQSVRVIHCLSVLCFCSVSMSLCHSRCCSYVICTVGLLHPSPVTCICHVPSCCCFKSLPADIRGRVLSLTQLAVQYLDGQRLNVANKLCMQQVPLYLSEISPPRWRGTLNLLFQCFCIFGILAAACINYGTVRTYWGWRLSLGLAAVPAVILGLGALTLPDSPNSLIFRGKVEEGRKVLEGYRGGWFMSSFLLFCFSTVVLSCLMHVEAVMMLIFDTFVDCCLQ